MDFIKLFYSVVLMLFIVILGSLFIGTMLSIGGIIGLTGYMSYLFGAFCLFCISVIHIYKKY